MFKDAVEKALYLACRVFMQCRQYTMRSANKRVQLWLDVHGLKPAIRS